MKTHTSAFKENIKKFGKEIDSIITYQLEGETIELGSENFNSIRPHYQGAILKSVMKQLDIDSKVNIPIGTELNYQFGVKINNYEFLDFGNYIVYSSEKQEDTNSYKIVCYDKMLYSMKDYENIGVTYPITIRNYINAICTHLGLTFANSSDTFANYDKQIPNELYLSSDGTSLNYTFRDVLDELAQVTASTICINDDDELEIRYINNTQDIIDEEYLKNVNVNFGEKFGPVNVIVLSRSAGSDNVYYPSTLPQNPYELKISDNQIMNGNNRSEFLPDIYNKLNGLEYYTNDFISTGICYYNLCDRYNVVVGENTYSCVMFNDEVNVTQGLEEHIYTDLPKETETDYKKADTTDRKINQTYLMVDKQNQVIQSLINQSVYISNTINGVGSVTLENAYEGRLYELSIKGQMSLLYPEVANLYPSNTTYPINSSLSISIDNVEYPLNFKLLNYIDNNVCDEFIYHDGEYKVIRRVGIDEHGNKYPLQEEFVDETGTVDLQVTSNSTIRLKPFENMIYKVTYLLDNQYTDVFATKVEMNSSITQTAEEINLEVSKKTDKDKIISTINQSAEQIQINANKISLQGTTIDLTAKDINIQSNNFSVNENGEITATAGEIGGFNMNSTQFKSNINGLYNFNIFDVGLIAMKIMDRIYLDSHMTNVLDIDENGSVGIIDYQRAKKIISGELQNTKVLQGTFEINSQDSKNCISIKDNYGNIVASLGLGGVNSTYITCENIVCGYPSSSYNNFVGITLNGNTGNINCVSLTQTSKEEYKKNFEKLENALDIIKSIDIYKYNMQQEEDTDKKHIGFIIGNDYNYSTEVTSQDNKGADIYSFISVCCQAIKEQQEKIESLEKRIEKLERESGK